MKGRMIQLDILRAIAVLMVIGAHLNRPGYSYPKPLFCPSGGFVGVWYELGWAGVDLFFVLSGFLVSGLLFREYIKHGCVRLGRFLLRRGFKIYPAFYVMLSFSLLVSITCHILFGWKLPRAANYLCEALFIQNYGSFVWNHTWSLAVEEHFYLAVGLCIFLLTKFSKKASNPFIYIPRIFAILAPSVLIIRSINSYAHPYYLYDNVAFRYNGAYSHLRCDSLFFGVLLSYLMNFHKDKTTSFVKKYKYSVLILSCIFVSPLLYVSRASNFYYTIGYTLLYLGFGGILLVALQWEIRSDLAYKLLLPFRLIGFYSYSIYLWHWPFLRWWSFLQGYILRHHYHSDALYLPHIYDWSVYIIGSIVIGIGMAKIIEVPFLRIRDRLFPSLSG